MRIRILFAGIGAMVLGAAAFAASEAETFQGPGDGRTDAGEAFVQAVKAVESTGRLYLPRGTFLIGSAVVPANIKLSFAPGAILKVKSGATLEVNGEIEASLQPIFAGPGKVTGAPRNLHVYPQWFGAAGDGKTDDGEALQQAAGLACGSMGRTLFIPEGNYLFSRIITIRSNVECRGALIRRVAIDPAKTRYSSVMFVDWFYPRETAYALIADDQEPVSLDENHFYGIKADSFKIPAWAGVPRKNDPEQTIDLAEGGTLIFKTTDFFSSRLNQKGDEYYTRNDICKLVSPQGDVFPEFCFSYEKPADAAPWNAAKTYCKGEYCTVDGQLYQSTFPSGPGAVYVNPHLGRIEIGPWSPGKGVRYPFQYANGSKDTVTLWVKAGFSVGYVPPQAPLTVNGLKIEVYSAMADDTFRLTLSGASLVCSRSNVTFNRLSVSCKDRFSLLSSMITVVNCANVVFNEAHISGATFHGLGYNILHSNVASIVYNNTISVNCRDAIAGRHGKNVLVNGGHYTRIDDHYGKNYTIRNAVFNAVSTTVPGYCTPQADVSKWRFTPSTALAFGGGELTVENCRFYNAGGILTVRGDTGGFGGTVFLKNLTVSSSGDVVLYHFAPDPSFDYAHQVKTPDHIVIEDVKLASPYRLSLQSRNLCPSPCRLSVRNCERLGNISLAYTEVVLSGCEFVNSAFNIGQGALVNLENCIFSGQIKGLTPAGTGYTRNNFRRKGATVELPLNYVNPAVFETE